MPADGSFERPGPAVTSRSSGRRSRAAWTHVCRHAPHGAGRHEYNPILYRCQHPSFRGASV